MRLMALDFLRAHCNQKEGGKQEEDFEAAQKEKKKS
jgi:hypothetical protein